jgi:hypothetical protein
MRSRGRVGTDKDGVFRGNIQTSGRFAVYSLLHHSITSTPFQHLTTRLYLERIHCELSLLLLLRITIADLAHIKRLPSAGISFEPLFPMASGGPNAFGFIHAFFNKFLGLLLAFRATHASVCWLGGGRSEGGAGEVHGWVLLVLMVGTLSVVEVMGSRSATEGGGWAGYL